MKLLKKLTALLLLTFGIPFSIALLVELFNPNEEPQDRQEALLALMILTLPSAAVGGWLAWGLHRQNQQEIGDRLLSTFYNLIKEGNGHINVLRFAMETKLTASAAKYYLDIKAKEFNADFDVSHDGSVIYYFALGNLEHQNTNITDSLSAYELQFDVIVTECPQNKIIPVIKVVRELTGLGLKEAKDFVESLPQTLKKGVAETMAKSWQQQLETVGAKVILIPYE